MPMLFADGESLLNCRQKVHWTETTDSCFANCSTQNSFCFLVANLFLWPQGSRGEEWNCKCDQNLNACCFVPLGNILLHAFLKPLWLPETGAIVLIHAVNSFIPLTSHDSELSHWHFRFVLVRDLMQQG
jgi:hypothetical protein